MLSDGGCGQGRGQGDPARRAPALQSAISELLPRRPAAGKILSVDPPAASGRGDGDAGPDDQDRDGPRLEAAALSILAENTAADPGFRVPRVDWERTGRDVVTMEWIDGIKMSDVEALARSPATTSSAIAANADAVLPAPHAARRLLPCRHASGQSVRRCQRHHRCRRPRHLGTPRKKERRFLAEILYGFITRDYDRVAEVHFEAGYVPAKHDVAAFAQAIRAIGEPIHGQPAETISMARLLTLAVRGDRAVRHGRRGPNWCCCRRPWWWSRAWRARSTPPSTCGGRPSRWSATGSPAISVRAGCWSSARTAPRHWFRSARQAPDLAARTERLSHAIDVAGRQGLRSIRDGKGDRQGRGTPQPLGPGGVVGHRADAGVYRLAPCLKRQHCLH